MANDGDIGNRSRLILGTAQLGMPYGIANRQGPPTAKEAHGLIETAWLGGVRRFDTAPAYAESERVLGAALAKLDKERQAGIITKVAGSGHPLDLVSSVKGSLQRLAVESVDTLLLHDEAALDLWKDVYGGQIAQIYEARLVRWAGVSVYTYQRAMQALALDGIKVIQIPGNALDRRFASPEFVEGVRARGVRLMVRSVFLQGLLLMDPVAVPAHLSPAVPAMKELREFAARSGLSLAALLMGYCAWKWPMADVLFGAESRHQVSSNLSAWDAGRSFGGYDRLEHLLEPCELDEHIQRPDMWGKERK